MSFASSASIFLRPAFILSASAMSSGESMRTVCCCTLVSATVILQVSQSPNPQIQRSVRDAVNELVDPELERVVVLRHRLEPLAGVFPELGDVGVVVGNHH